MELTVEEKKALEATRGRAWRAANPGKNAESQRKWRAANVQKKRDYQLRRNYNITSVQYEEMLAAQHYKCSICLTTKPSGWHLDHCHKTGKVRALLCAKCNLALGLFDHRFDLTKSATDYLRFHEGAP